MKKFHKYVPQLCYVAAAVNFIASIIASFSGNHATILCGLATTDVLNRYQDDNLILSPALRRRGTKTGFYGFEHLIKIESIDDIAAIVR